MGEALTIPTMDDRERDELGRIKETFLLDDVHDTLSEIEPAGTADVRDALGSSYETAYKKLRALEDQGRVSSRKVGNARLWSTVEMDQSDQRDDETEETTE